MPLYIGPQDTDKLAEDRPGLDWWSSTAGSISSPRPSSGLLNFIHGVVGNWGWSIILLTILISSSSTAQPQGGRSMAAMKVLGPKMEKLKQLYGDDRQKLNQAMMELYRTEKINPLGGCLPIVVQIPVFIALYWVLLASIELRHAPWLGWIQDLSAPDPWYILPVVYAVSMFVQTKLNPQPADPVQAKVMLAMPLSSASSSSSSRRASCLLGVQNLLPSPSSGTSPHARGSGGGEGEGETLRRGRPAGHDRGIATAPCRGGIGIVRIPGHGGRDRAVRHGPHAGAAPRHVLAIRRRRRHSSSTRASPSTFPRPIRIPARTSRVAGPRRSGRAARDRAPVRCARCAAGRAG